MSVLRFLFLIIFTVFICDMVFCDDGNSSKKRKKSTVYKYKKRTDVEFSEVELEGAFQKPEGYYSLKAKKTRFDNLVTPKYDFMDELKRSVYTIDEE